MHSYTNSSSGAVSILRWLCASSPCHQPSKAFEGAAKTAAVLVPWWRYAGRSNTSRSQVCLGIWLNSLDRSWSDRFGSV